MPCVSPSGIPFHFLATLNLKWFIWLTVSLFRPEDKDVEHGSSHRDISEKLARMSMDDTSLADWHLGFHIYLVLLTLSFGISYSPFTLALICGTPLPQRETKL